MDVQTLFDKAGGATRLAARIGVARTTVLDWRRTGFIPGNRVAQIGKALGIPTEELLKLVQPGKTRVRERRTSAGAASSSEPLTPKPKTKRSAATPSKPTPIAKREPKQSAEPLPLHDQAA